MENWSTIWILFTVLLMCAGISIVIQVFLLRMGSKAEIQKLMGELFGKEIKTIQTLIENMRDSERLIMRKELEIREYMSDIHRLTEDSNRLRRYFENHIEKMERELEQKELEVVEYKEKVRKLEHITDIDCKHIEDYIAAVGTYIGNGTDASKDRYNAVATGIYWYVPRQNWDTISKIDRAVRSGDFESAQESLKCLSQSLACYRKSED